MYILLHIQYEQYEYDYTNIVATSTNINTLMTKAADIDDRIYDQAWTQEDDYYTLDIIATSYENDFYCIQPVEHI